MFRYTCAFISSYIDVKRQIYVQMHVLQKETEEICGFSYHKCF